MGESRSNDKWTLILVLLLTGCGSWHYPCGFTGAGCMRGGTPTATEEKKVDESQPLRLGAGKGYRHYDGCNTTTCSPGGFCTTTLANCSVPDTSFADGLPPCEPGVPLKKGESCSFEVQP